MLFGPFYLACTLCIPQLTSSRSRLCAKLYLKAETQQVDRILEEFSRRYWECNPGCIYGSASEYSLYLRRQILFADENLRSRSLRFVFSIAA